MAIDTLVALLTGGVGDIFAGGAAVGAADAAAAGAADVLGATAAADAAGVGAGAADLLGAGAADAFGAGAADAAGAAAAGDLTTAGAADLLGGAGAGLDIPAAVDVAALGDLGSPVGGAAENALAFAPTPADAAVQTAGASQGLLSSAAPQAADVSAQAAAATPVTSPAEELATGNPQLKALLASNAGDVATPATEATTAQTAMSGQAIPFSNSPFSGGAPSVTPDAATALANAPATPSAGTAAPSLSSEVGSVLNNPITKAAELALPLGMIGYEAMRGPAPIPPQAQAAVNNATSQLAPLQNEATKNVPLYQQTAANDLNLANNFQISPAQAASIQTFVQNSQNQLLQQLANEGNVNPMQTSAWVQGNNQIQQQALAMQVQMVNQLISTAFQSASAANAGVSTASSVTNALDSTLMQAAQLQIQNDTAFQQALASAMQSFGLMAALSNVKVA